MKYELDSLNVDEYGSYIFVSKNGREYDLGDVSTIQQNPFSDSKSYDIVAIYDFNAPDPDYPGETKTVLVKWFFGSNFNTHELKNTENNIRECVDEYEKKLDIKKNKEIMDKKEMVNYKTVINGVYGECLGKIYMEMIRKASGKFSDAEKLKDFSKDLWEKLYSKDYSNKETLFIGYCEDAYSFNPDTSEEKINHWYKVYEENGNQWADKIEIIKEKTETIAKNVCINEAFDIMRKEIDENMTDCKFRVKAYQQVYDGLEHYYYAVFTIINGEDSVLNSKEEIDKYIYKYDFLYKDGAFTINRISC